MTPACRVGGDIATSKVRETVATARQVMGVRYGAFIFVLPILAESVAVPGDPTWRSTGAADPLHQKRDSEEKRFRGNGKGELSESDLPAAGSPPLVNRRYHSW
jgi:hypothetical protein